MSAELYIHVLGKHSHYDSFGEYCECTVTERDVAEFSSNVIGSKHFNINSCVSAERSSALYTIVSHSPNMWVGEVSWLKASLFDDPTSYISAPVAAISDIIGEDLPIIDDAMIKKIRAACKMMNTTTYSMNAVEAIVLFLEKYKGERCFTVSW